ncbi:hypothetical protein [Bradyrhizobium sp. USDA 4011]
MSILESPRSFIWWHSNALSVILGSHLTDTAQGFGTGLQIIFGTAVFGTFIELLRRTYNAAIKRLATIDLFASEILSIMRVVASANIIGDFIRLYERIGVSENAPVQTANASTSAMEATGAVGFADSARNERLFHNIQSQRKRSGVPRSRGR